MEDDELVRIGREPFLAHTGIRHAAGLDAAFAGENAASRANHAVPTARLRPGCSPALPFTLLVPADATAPSPAYPCD